MGAGHLGQQWCRVFDEAADAPADCPTRLVPTRPARATARTDRRSLRPQSVGSTSEESNEVGVDQ